jgi:coenzyme Q-binding protein COQ10
MLFPYYKSAVTSFLRSSPVTKRHGESRILPTHPLHLFRIIQDVDRYQEFLPLCKSSQVYPDTIRDNGRLFQAKLIVGKPPLFSEEYVSQVTVMPERLRVESESISTVGNTFESLKSSWQLRRVNIPKDDDDHDDDTKGRESGSAKPSSHNIYDDDDGDDDDWKSSIGCHVDFQVEMTVTDPVIVRILDTVLMQVAGHQVEAFDRRCQELPWPEQLIADAERTWRE